MNAGPVDSMFVFDWGATAGDDTFGPPWTSPHTRAAWMLLVDANSAGVCRIPSTPDTALATPAGYSSAVPSAKIRAAPTRMREATRFGSRTYARSGALASIAAMGRRVEVDQRIVAAEIADRLAVSASQVIHVRRGR